MVQKSGSIQGLKGIAAFIVFLSHALMTFKSDLVLAVYHSPFHFLFDGQCSVMIFFSISGFFYYNAKNSSVKSYFSGIRKKIKKIYPPYIIIMIVGYFLCNLHLDYPASLFTDWSNSFWVKDVSFVELLKQLSILYPHDSKLINSPVWYLNIEVKCFLIIPLIIIAFKSKYGGIWCLFPFWFLMIFGKFSYLGSFLIGSYCRYLIINKPKLIDLLNKDSFRLSMMVLGIIMLNIRNEIDIFPSNANFIIQSIGASIIVSILYIKSYPLFEYQICRWLGDISYEFYLIHFIVILTLKSFCLSFWVFFILSLFISIFIAFFINTLLQSINQRIDSIKIK